MTNITTKLRLSRPATSRQVAIEFRVTTGQSGFALCLTAPPPDTRVLQQFVEGR